MYQGWSRSSSSQRELWVAPNADQGFDRFFKYLMVA